jgi:hypothetical protein
MDARTSCGTGHRQPQTRRCDRRVRSGGGIKRLPNARTFTSLGNHRRLN